MLDTKQVLFVLVKREFSCPNIFPVNQTQGELCIEFDATVMVPKAVPTFAAGIVGA
jgi:hypothetical protein